MNARKPLVRWPSYLRHYPLTPADIDTKGEFYCFERGAAKQGGGNAWATVLKHGHFG